MKVRAGKLRTLRWVAGGPRPRRSIDDDHHTREAPVTQPVTLRIFSDYV